ncbi:MAG: OBAP family protein [Thermoproteota archaeon]|nr:OBAP family protein [Thermoproteota archaeon]
MKYNHSEWNKENNSNFETRIILGASLIAFLFGLSVVTLIAAQAQNATQAQNMTQTTKGFGGPPSGPLTAVRHIFDDPTLRVWHFCKPNDKIMMVCQLYDSNSPNATLIGVEYMITADAFKNIPDRDKPNWHYHKEEFAPNRADPKLPMLSEQQQNATMKSLAESYGKIIITWNPNDKAPIFPPQVIQVQHPFMVNATVSPETETQAGTFNQTLEY